MLASILFFNLLCAIIAAPLAHLRGRSATGWFVGCLLLGPIGVVLLLRLPRLKRCPQCGIGVRRDAPLCFFCGYDFAEHHRQTITEEYRYCANCQRAVDKDALTCPVCGHLLS